MPVVHVRSLVEDGAAAEAALAAVAVAVAAAVPCTSDDVWCTFQVLAAATIGDRAAGARGRIAYVDLWQRHRAGDPAAGGRALEAACRAAAAALGLPVEDVWGALHPVEPGCVFAGGALLAG